MSELSEINAALDAAGCPTGNEHRVYDAVERIAGLHKTRDYAWKQLDTERAAREAANAKLSEAMMLLEILVQDGKGLDSSDCNHANLCVRWQAAEQFLSSIEPPALLKELQGLREGFDALVKGTIAARKKSNAQLRVAKDALEKFTTKIEGSTASVWGLEVAFLAGEALSQLNGVEPEKRSYKVELTRKEPSHEKKEKGPQGRVLR